MLTPVQALLYVIVFIVGVFYVIVGILFYIGGDNRSRTDRLYEAVGWPVLIALGMWHLYHESKTSRK